MASLNPFTWWRRFLALPNDSPSKTFLVAFMVAVVSAVAVAFTAVALKPLQDANVARDRQERMAEMLVSVPGLADILGQVDAEAVETRLVDLNTGEFNESVDPGGYDMAAAANDPGRSIALVPADDIAGLGRRANLAPVHFVRDQDGGILLVVLPGHAQGYQSTIRAYIALQGDLNTIAAVSIYEQGETPGLGTRIAEPDWQGSWAGKQVMGEDGTVQIEVVRSGASGSHQVDAITGATRSSMGVSNLVRFWLGKDGFGPFLAKLRAGED